MKHEIAQQALADAQAYLDRGELDAGLVAATRAATQATDPATRARAGWLQAQFTYRRGDYAGVLSLAEDLSPMLRAHRSDELRELQRAVAFAGAEIGRFDRALAAAYEVHALAEATGRPGPRSQAHNTLGICFERMGDPWQAERLLREALTIAREGAPLRELFGALNNLCAVLIGSHYLQRGSEVTAASLAALAALPDDTQVCCTHEYTLSNLRFAAAVEPANCAIAAHDAHCRALREAELPTLPSTMALERRINPFLRCSEPAVMAAARREGAANDEPVAVLAALREWKNRFR
jgi:tetratricopeptide (TPR) repeat protein